MEQLCQPGGDILFQCGDACHDILHGFRCLILVEIAGHGDLVAHLGLAVVDPCVGGVGQNFPGKVGETVKVVKLTGEGAVKRRIMDMGITKGVEVYVRKVAPLGDPVEVTVRGYELSLRKADAEMITVE